MGKYIMAFDAGTTSSRCILFNEKGEVCSTAQKEFTQYFPKPGWVEHNANEIWSTQLGVAVEAMSKIGALAADISAIGITNQRETTIVWDKAAGEPVCPAIVWQCRRTADYCDSLKKQGFTEMIREKTGLVLDAYFSATKLKWILDHVPGARERAQRGELLFGTVETWLIWKLTRGKVHVTDYSNASRTMLFNINTLTWDADILRLLDIPECMLPKAVPTGTEPVFSKSGLVTTIAWGLDGKVTYALEGSIFAAGAAIQWLRDQLRIIESAADSEYMAAKVKDTNGCYVVPAFTGLGAPHWDPYARGAILGLTRGVNKYHIIRATLDSLCYQTNDVLEAMKADLGRDILRLKADGGASANNYLLQTQADLTGVQVDRPSCVETTAMGAAYLAGLAVGFWKNKDEIARNWKADRSFCPGIEQEQRNRMLKGWQKAVRCSYGWAMEEP